MQWTKTHILLHLTTEITNTATAAKNPIKAAINTMTSIAIEAVDSYSVHLWQLGMHAVDPFSR